MGTANTRRRWRTTHAWSASVSYMVAPAVLRYAIPVANAAIYFELSLGVTFPLNISVSIPACTSIARTALT
jgi:hypothetical protein